MCGALQEIWVRVLSEASSIRLLPFPLSIFFSSLFSLVACFVACIPVNSSRDPTAPGHNTPGSSKIPFPDHPTFVPVRLATCLSARVSRNRKSFFYTRAPTPQHHAHRVCWAIHTNEAQRSSSVLHDGFSDISHCGYASAPCGSAGPRPTQWPCCSAAASSTEASIAFPPAGKRGNLVAAWYVLCFPTS